MEERADNVITDLLDLAEEMVRGGQLARTRYAYR
jgi:hypothetical protein